MDRIDQAKTNLSDFVTKIDPVIQLYFAKEYEDAKLKYNNDCLSALSFYEDIVKRGSFVYFVYKMFGGQDEKAALDLSVVVELIHAYLLVIDDINDRSDTRRGGLTAHKMAINYFDENNLKYDDRVHFGNSVAVLSGLMGNHMAMTLLNGLDASDSTKLRLYKNLNEKITITAYGQLVDFFNETRIFVDENDVMDMLKWKTGVYTYENPIHMGAILAQQTDDVLSHLTEFAIPAGIAFQIQDDILGVFGDPEVTGKSAKGDLEEGKITLLVNYVLNHAKGSTKEEFMQILGSSEITDEQLQIAREIIESTGALKYAREKAIYLTDIAHDALEKHHTLSWEEKYVNHLHGITDYMIARNK